MQKIILYDILTFSENSIISSLIVQRRISEKRKHTIRREELVCGATLDNGEICGQTTRGKWNMKRHMKIHIKAAKTVRKLSVLLRDKIIPSYIFVNILIF